MNDLLINFIEIAGWVFVVLWGISIVKHGFYTMDAELVRRRQFYSLLYTLCFFSVAFMHNNIFSMVLFGIFAFINGRRYFQG